MVFLKVDKKKKNICFLKLKIESKRTIKQTPA